MTLSLSYTHTSAHKKREYIDREVGKESFSSESMVSLQASISQEERKSVSPNLETSFSSSKKRNWQEAGGDDHDQESKEPKLWKKERVEFHFDSPLPLEWQRCLDIKSGQIHFYNTRTNKRTSKDPRSSTESHPSLSLDLELNLYSTKHVDDDGDQQVQTHKHEPMISYNIDDHHQHHQHHHYKSSNKSLCSPSWITLDVEDRQQEMVAAVCMRCHMLVMMCKATPSCPNCKFVHPQDHNSSSSLLNTKLKPVGFTLLCCKN